MRTRALPDRSSGPLAAGSSSGPPVARRGFFWRQECRQNHQRQECRGHGPQRGVGLPSAVSAALRLQPTRGVVLPGHTARPGLMGFAWPGRPPHGTQPSRLCGQRASRLLAHPRQAGRPPSAQAGRPAFLSALAFALALLLILPDASAQSPPAGSTSASASYELLHSSAGNASGGGRATTAGAAITADLSVGDPASGHVTTLTTGGVQTKGNLIGQLYDATAITATATPPAVNEGATTQITARARLDDGTTLDLRHARGTRWEPGPALAAFDPLTGLATAASVTADTPSHVTVTWRSREGRAAFTILNVPGGPTYAGDALDDDWQELHFGPPPNINAAPDADPDGDGQDNLTEFLAGTTPTNPSSFLQLSITGFSAPGVLDFRLSKVLPGRTYTLKANADLASPPVIIGTPLTPAAEQPNQLFQDHAATGPRKFYTLEITQP